MIDQAQVERDFAALLANGWPPKVETAPKVGWLPKTILHHHMAMATQLVDSSVPTTREHWRRMLGAPDEIATDPRPFAAALLALNAKDDADDR